MTRAAICILALASLIGTGCVRPMSTAAPLGPKPFDVVETPMSDLRRAMAEGRITSRQLVVEYLTRIALYEDQFEQATKRRVPPPSTP